MIRIGGLQKITLIDYPGKIAASVFLIGCNFRCPFCHNPELIEYKPGNDIIEEQDFFAYLNKRQKHLDGVCVSGGEPLLYSALDQFLKKIKDLGYLIKLDTNGTSPDKLKQLIDKKLVDFIAMDIKGCLDNYQEIVKKTVNLDDIKKSIEIIMTCGLDYEFRTTVLPCFHSLENMEKIGKMIKGADIYYLQQFINKNTLDPEFTKQPSFTDQQLEQLKTIALKYVKNCQIRN